jgi:poly(hydroxyalkanoate) depolymerase family esterase
LHGCGSGPDDEAQQTRWPTIAAKRNVIVAFPQQDLKANGTGCWNWFLPADQKRDSGEPSIIAGITAAVQKRWHADPRRTYVGGISAGAGMAINMVASYPDMYAAALLDAGCEYLGTTCTGGPGGLPPSVSGDLEYAAMGQYERVVPLIVVHGSFDFTVPPVDSVETVQAALHIADRVAQAADSSTTTTITPTHQRTDRTAGGVTSEVRTYDDSHGCPLVQHWLVHGMGHEWSDAPPSKAHPVTFTKGPDITSIALDWFLQHPMQRGTRECQTAR